MKSLIFVLLAVSGSALAANVDGYIRKDGTYVAPHQRSNPNSNKMDNYSSQGNVNPYTGQQGTVNPYQQPQPQYQNPYGQQPKQPRY